MIIASDRRQARVIKRYISGLLHERADVGATIEDETQREHHVGEQRQHRDPHGLFQINARLHHRRGFTR